VTILLRSQGLSRSYGSLPALVDLDLELKKGEITGLLGPDGAGKTSAMRLLTGLIRPDRGTVWLGEEEVTGRRASSGRIGYMPQRFSLYPDLSVDENMRFYARVFGVPASLRKERSERLLHFARLTEFRRRRAAALSGGMKQKLALACTLIHAPEVLLLDEPTTGVDPISRIELWEILTDLREEGTTILVSTPYMDEADKCDFIVILQEGKALDRGTPAQLRERFPDQILEVEAEPLGRAARVMEESSLIKSVVPFGTRLHLTLPAGKMDVKSLVNLLNAEGVRTGEVTMTQPSLEDVFVALAPEETAP
jgi:ABC-2 type transport system ATP-binding protein